MRAAATPGKESHEGSNRNQPYLRLKYVSRA